MEMEQMTYEELLQFLEVIKTEPKCVAMLTLSHISVNGEEHSGFFFTESQKRYDHSEIRILWFNDQDKLQKQVTKFQLTEYLSREQNSTLTEKVKDIRETKAIDVVYPEETENYFNNIQNRRTQFIVAAYGCRRGTTLSEILQKEVNIH